MSSSCCGAINENIEMSSSFEFYKNLIDSNDISSSGIAIFVGILVIIFTGVLFKLIGRKSRRSGILLLGCSDSGKTNLFSQLIDGKSRDTQTSLIENTAPYTAATSKKEAELKLYDLPGHESIRYKFLEKFKDFARGIVFVVDSESFQKTHQDVAEFLFRVLTDKSISKSAPSICVACNKQDLLLAKSKNVIFNQLEKELNTLRRTQSAALASTDDSGDRIAFLGKKDQDFKFEHLSKFKVEFIECSTKGNEELPVAKIEELESWISSLL